MGVTANLVVRSRFTDRTAADRIARYLPEEGRAALIDDVAPEDQSAYSVVELLEYAVVERRDDNTLECSFEFSDVDDFDEEVPRVLARFQQLGASELLGIVMADEDIRAYAVLTDERIALFVLERARAKSLRKLHERRIFEKLDELLAAGVDLWPGELWDAPHDPPKPLLVILPVEPDED